LLVAKDTIRRIANDARAKLGRQVALKGFEKLTGTVQSGKEHRLHRVALPPSYGGGVGRKASPAPACEVGVEWTGGPRVSSMSRNDR